MLNILRAVVRIGYIHPTRKLTCIGHMGHHPLTTATVTVFHPEYICLNVIPSLTRALSHFTKAPPLKINLFPRLTQYSCVNVVYADVTEAISHKSSV